jgi:integrase/recombinase XerD
MAYQFVRERLRPEEADRLCHACQTTDEKLVVWTLQILVCGCPSYET